MKAREYAARYAETKAVSGQDAAILEMWRVLLHEFKEIKELRHAQTVDAQLAIMDELDRKWRAICRQVGDSELNEDGYAAVIQENMPALYRAWKRIPLSPVDAGKILRTYAMLGAIFRASVEPAPGPEVTP